MTIGSILLGLALLALVGLYISRPLLQPEGRRGRHESERQRLLTQKEAVLIEIQTLDFDYSTGKLPEAEYQHQRSQCVDQAKGILMQLDGLEPGLVADASVKGLESRESQIDQEIEAAVAVLRQDSLPTPDKRAAIKAAPSSNGKSRFCPECGQATDPGDKFCAHCGHRLRQPRPT